MTIRVHGNGLIVRRTKSKQCELGIEIHKLYIQHTFIIIESKEVKSKQAQIKIVMQGCE